MIAMDLDRYKRLLLAKRDELLPATLRTSLTAGTAEGHRGDPTDRASEDAQTALQVHLSESDIHLLQAVEQALARIEHVRLERVKPASVPSLKPG